MTRTLPVLVALLAAAAQAAEGAKSLTLDEALSLAASNQPALRQARAGADAAGARVKETLAPMLPQLNLQATDRQTSAGCVPTASFPCPTGTTFLPTTTVNAWNGTLTLSGTLWDFGRSLRRLQASEASQAAAQSGVGVAESSARLTVRQAFFTAAAQKELVEVARVTFQNTDLHYTQTEGFVRVGTRPEIDLATARSQRANARVQLVQAQAAYLVAKARLNQAIGVEGPTDYEVAVPAFPAVEGEGAGTEALLPEALKARPEVAQLQAQVRAQQLTLLSVSNNYFPILGASLSAGVAGRDLAGGANYGGGVSLNWPLYEGGLTLSQEAENQALLRQLQAQADGLTLQVRLDVETARTQVQSSIDALAAAQDAEAAAKEQLRLAEARYQAGAGSAVELNDAQVTFTTASAQRVQAVYTLATARASLLAALGR